MVNNSLILKENELLSLLGDVIAEQNYEEDVKNMSYEEYLKKYTLKDVPKIRAQYDKLQAQNSPKVVEKSTTPTMGECYDLTEKPTNVDVTSDGTRNYVFETEELSGWDTGEEYLEVQFKLSPKEMGVYDDHFDKWRGRPPIMLRFEMDQGARTPDIKWAIRPETCSSGWGTLAMEGTGSGGAYGGNVAGPIYGGDCIDIKLRIPSNPSTWAETETNKAGQAVYNWPRYAGVNGTSVWVTANIQIQIWKDIHIIERNNYDNDMSISQRRKLQSYNFLDKSECNANIALYAKFDFGTLGGFIWDEYILQSPWTKQGKKDWGKSAFNPKNYSVHVWLDLLAIAALIVAGIFSGGAGWAAAAYYASMTIYAVSTLSNAILYYQKGDTQMAGIHLLFEALPYVKITKRLAQIPKALYAGSVKNAFKAIGTVAPGGFKTNKAALKILKGHPYAADMVKSLAKYGDDALMKMQGSLKGGLKTSSISNKVANEFIQAVAKESPAIAGRITTQSAKKIIIEQGRTFTKRMIQFLSGTGSIMGDALILAALYDADMIWEPFQLYVLDKKGEEVTTSGWPGLRNVQDSLHEFTLKTATEQSTLLQKLFGDWKVRDTIVTTKDEKGRRYHWPTVRAIYIATIANPRIADNSCDTIPAERHSVLYEKHKYTPANEEEKMKYDAKQHQKSAGDLQGIPINAKDLLYKGDVNTALKEDFINGWRPEQKCHEADYTTNTETEMKKRNEELKTTLLEKELDETDAELWYRKFLTPGLTAYKERTDEYLIIGGVEFKPQFTKEAIELLTNNFTLKMKECLRDNMAYYKNWKTIPEEEGIGSSGTPKPPCNQEELLN